MVFDAATGTPAALMDGDAITAARTAAGSRLATRLLSRGRGRAGGASAPACRARRTSSALTREREWAEIRVWGRREDRARGLAARHEATPFASVRGRRRGRRAWSASPRRPPSPSLRREWLAPGAHVNSVGYSTAGRELDPALVRDALVVVESRESALAPPPAGSTDLEEAQDAIELGELVAGRPGRTSPEQLTLYKSVGVAPRGRRGGRSPRLARRGASAGSAPSPSSEASAARASAPAAATSRPPRSSAPTRTARG